MQKILSTIAGTLILTASQLSYAQCTVTITNNMNSDVINTSVTSSNNKVTSTCPLELGTDKGSASCDIAIPKNAIGYITLTADGGMHGSAVKYGFTCLDAEDGNTATINVNTKGTNWTTTTSGDSLLWLLK